jgi:hypothetical protein
MGGPLLELGAGPETDSGEFSASRFFLISFLTSVPKFMQHMQIIIRTKRPETAAPISFVPGPILF